jgi:hypothetical protein
VCVCVGTSEHASVLLRTEEGGGATGVYGGVRQRNGSVNTACVLTAVAARPACDASADSFCRAELCATDRCSIYRIATGAVEHDRARHTSVTPRACAAASFPHTRSGQTSKAAQQGLAAAKREEADR